jgi:hypothetical protein
LRLSWWRGELKTPGLDKHIKPATQLVALFASMGREIANRREAEIIAAWTRTGPAGERLSPLFDGVSPPAFLSSRRGLKRMRSVW